MVKIKKRSKQKFNYNKDRRRAWKKSKKLPTVKCDQVKAAWDDKKSTKQNMMDMGLSYNPNTTLPIPKTKDAFGDQVEEMELSKVLIKPSKIRVAQDLESEANQPQARGLRLSQPDVKNCIYMMEKYGEDYKAMTRDDRNYYQDTPKQIRRRIVTFKSIPEQYNEYLESKRKKHMDVS